MGGGYANIKPRHGFMLKHPLAIVKDLMRRDMAPGRILCIVLTSHKEHLSVPYPREPVEMRLIIRKRTGLDDSIMDSPLCNG
jgi:hypothetical protein